MSQLLDQRIKAKIAELVGEGVRRVAEMQRRLNHYVKNELFLGQESPSFLNRRFFPEKKDIRNHIYLALIASR